LTPRTCALVIAAASGKTQTTTALQPMKNLLLVLPLCAALVGCMTAAQHAQQLDSGRNNRVYQEFFAKLDRSVFLHKQGL
jgi:hypothetical protein